MASQKSGARELLQCAELSVHARVALSTQKAHRLWRNRQEVDPLAVVGCEVPGRLCAPTQPQESEHEGGGGVRSAAPGSPEAAEPGNGASQGRLHRVEVGRAIPDSRGPRKHHLSMMSKGGVDRPSGHGPASLWPHSVHG